MSTEGRPDALPLSMFQLRKQSSIGLNQAEKKKKNMSRGPHDGDFARVVVTAVPMVTLGNW